MIYDNAGAIPKDIHDALQDDQEWRNSDQHPREVWNIYKAVRRPKSYLYLIRPTRVKILGEHGPNDPCPISEAEWAEQNPIDAGRLAKRRASYEAKRRKTRKLISDTFPRCDGFLFIHVDYDMPVRLL